MVFQESINFDPNYLHRIVANVTSRQRVKTSFTLGVLCFHECLGQMFIYLFGVIKCNPKIFMNFTVESQY